MGKNKVNHQDFKIYFCSLISNLYDFRVRIVSSTLKLNALKKTEGLTRVTPGQREKERERGRGRDAQGEKIGSSAIDP